MSSEFYAYMLIDPRTDKPFYIGKGKGRRCKSHVIEARTSRKNTHKLNTIRKIESLGLSVRIRKVDENISDLQAQEFEKLLIQECRAFGIELTNKTDGGDGGAGYKHTPESLRKISESQKGKTVSEETRQKISAYVKQNNPMHHPEVVAKTTGESHWNYGKPAKNKGSHWTDEQRKAQSELFSGVNNPQYGKPCSESRREAIRRGTTGVKKSTTINMRKPRSKITCPHCGKVGGSNTMHRWHFDNCKENHHAD